MAARMKSEWLIAVVELFYPLFLQPHHLVGNGYSVVTKGRYGVVTVAVCAEALDRCRSRMYAKPL